MRGTITGYGRTNVADLAEIPDGAWALRGERGLTYAATLPQGSSLTAGRWWPKDYAGEPLVSVDERLVEILGLKLGDELRYTIYGVEQRARIASFRRIDWDTLGFNFVLVFSPNALAKVPHNLSATIVLPRGGDAAVREAIAGRFPSTSLVPVRDVLEQVERGRGRRVAGDQLGGGGGDPGGDRGARGNDFGDARGAQLRRGRAAPARRDPAPADQAPGARIPDPCA